MKKFLVILCLCILVPLCALGQIPSSEKKKEREAYLRDMQKRVDALQPDPAFPDDVYALVVIKQALLALRDKSGGVGACLVDERTGKVVEVGRNAQYSGYFRSDLHAEMDLLTRYEDRVKKSLSGKKNNPRACEGLVLYSSVEPCPMCLTRIINSGIKKTYFVATDPDGGMVSRLNDLPPFWQKFAQGRIFAQADCSPQMKAVATELFGAPMHYLKP